MSIISKAPVTDSVTEEVEATVEGTAVEGTAVEERRLRKKPSWMEDYQM